MISGKEGVGGWKKKRISSEGGGESWEGEKKRWGLSFHRNKKSFSSVNSLNCLSPLQALQLARLNLSC